MSRWGLYKGFRTLINEIRTMGNSVSGPPHNLLDVCQQAHHCGLVWQTIKSDRVLQELEVIKQEAKLLQHQLDEASAFHALLPVPIFQLVLYVACQGSAVATVGVCC